MQRIFNNLVLFSLVAATLFGQSDLDQVNNDISHRKVKVHEPQRNDIGVLPIQSSSFDVLAVAKIDEDIISKN